MPSAEKIERVAELKERLGASDAVLLTEYRGLSVSEISELRRSLAEGGASFAVVKNTLMRRAAEESSMADLLSLLEGPTAVAFVEGDAVAAAKKVVEAIRRFPALVLKGGFMDGRMLSAADARALADLESREVMLSMIAGLLKGEMSRAAAMFGSAQSKFVSLMVALKDKLPAEPEPEPEPEAPTEAATPAEHETQSEAETETKTETETETEMEMETAAADEATPAADEATEVTDDQRTDAAAPADDKE